MTRDIQKNQHPRIKQMLDGMQSLSTHFGEYTYLYDNSPGKVLDANMYAKIVKEMSTVEVADSLIRLASTSKYGAAIASAILMDLQHWDELLGPSR